MKKYFISVFIFLLLANFALAHGVGKTIEQVAGEYSASLTVSEQEIYTNEPVRFTFELAKGEQLVPFSSVWVKIENDENIFLTAEVHQPLSGLLGSLNYTFLKAGDYQLTARYAKDDNKITETIFPLSVTAEILPEAIKAGNQQPWLYGIIGLLIGAASVFVINRKKT